MRPGVSQLFRSFILSARLLHDYHLRWLICGLFVGTVAAAFFALPARGVFSGSPVSLATIGVAYMQDFNSLANAGTSSTTPAGWGFVETGSGANTTYAAGTGSSSTGDTYSFGAAGNAERAFGQVRSGSVTTTLGACFTNNTGVPITKLTINYTGEQWRAGVTNRGAADRMDFQYSTNATDLTTGMWTDVNALDFASPNISTASGALDGNNASNRTALSFTITGINIANGSTFFIRWTDFDISSSDDGLGIDDFSLTPETSPPPPNITTQPMAQSVCVGQTASFSVAATGIAPLGYQWRKNGTAIMGATNSTFTIGAVTLSDDADYDVIVSDVNGNVTSNVAHLTVNTPVTVTTQPTNAIVAPGAMPVFTAAATGTAPITVQWQVSTNNGATWANIGGATTTTLTLPAVTAADNNKRYRAQFTNPCGTVNSNTVVLTVLPVSAQILDPFACIGEGTTLDVKVQITNPTAAIVDGVFRARLEPGLVTRNSSCVVTGDGTCSFTDQDRVRWGGSIPPGQTVTITYQVQVAPGVANGTELCINSTFEFNGGQVAAVRACTRVNCNIIPAPGVVPPDIAPSDTKPGSVLFFNFYASDIAQPHLENTRFNITNTDTVRLVNLHLFFVNADDCRVADAFVCLTPNQTFSFLASEYDPGQRGFLWVVAVDGQRGCPINFNYLIGSEFIKLASGHAANLGARAISALPGGPRACDPTDTTARLDFDGTDYGLVPRALAVNTLQSPVDGNSTLLILNRVGGNFSTGTATRLGDLLGLVYDDKERGYSFGFDPSGCQYVSRIFDGAPRIAPPLTRVIPSGHTGWMRLQHVTEAAMFGATINFNPRGFNQGHHLTALSYIDASITIPIQPPVCGQ